MSRGGVSLAGRLALRKGLFRCPLTRLHMLYRFRVIDPVREDFVREYELDPCGSFYDFHQALARDLALSGEELASFFMASEQWERGLELTLIDMVNDTEMAAIPMDSVAIRELVQEEGARLIYTFDVLQDRSLFVQLLRIDPNADAPGSPRCCRSEGGNPASGPSALEIANRDIEELLRCGYDGGTGYGAENF